MVNVVIDFNAEEIKKFFLKTNAPTVIAWSIMLIIAFVSACFYNFNYLLVGLSAIILFYLCSSIFRGVRACKLSIKSNTKVGPISITFNNKGISLKLVEDTQDNNSNSLTDVNNQADDTKQPKESSGRFVPWAMIIKTSKIKGYYIFKLPKNNIIFIPSRCMTLEQFKQAKELRQSETNRKN